MRIFSKIKFKQLLLYLYKIKFHYLNKLQITRELVLFLSDVDY